MIIKKRNKLFQDSVSASDTDGWVVNGKGGRKVRYALTTPTM
jgi:hypothetical protein